MVCPTRVANVVSQLSNVEDADRCRDKCAASPECNYFTWIKWVQLLFHGLSECNYFTWIKWVQLLYMDQVSATTLPGSYECNYFTWIKWVNCFTWIKLVQLLYLDHTSAPTLPGSSECCLLYLDLTSTVQCTLTTLPGFSACNYFT